MIGEKGAVRFGDAVAQAVSRRFYGAVDAEADLDDISEDARADGMGALVLADHSMWVFDADSAATAAAGQVRQPVSGGGRWHIASAAGATTAPGAVQILSVAVGHADLTAAATSQSVNLGAALPANARILGTPNIKLETPFSGGGAAAATVDVGSAGDPDALVDGANVFAAAVDGQASSVPPGIASHKHFAASTQLTATFASDVNVAALTAGACTIEVAYTIRS
jgi:hypothetical protein